MDAFASPFQYERSTGNNIFSLARLFDSLVRVSRRVKTPHFLSPNVWDLGGRRRGSPPVKGVPRVLVPSPIPDPMHLYAAGGTPRIMLAGWFWPMKWRCFHCHCHDFRVYVTLFPKCFSNFRSRYLFDIGLSTLYLTLADTYLPLDTAFPNSATLLVHLMRRWGHGRMG